MDLGDYKAEVRRDNRDQGDVNEKSNHKSNYFRNDMHPACKHQLHRYGRNTNILYPVRHIPCMAVVSRLCKQLVRRM